MASHHAMSPSTALHGHPGAPPQHVQPNGYPPPVPNPRPTHQDYITQANIQTWLQLASTSEKMSNNQVALDAYHAVLKWDKWNIPALRGIAGILRSEDKFDQAVDYIRSILGVQPSDGESWSSLGHCYLMMDELQQAYSAYQSALYNLTDPKEPKLWYGIGILYDRYGSLDHAEEAFSQVMRMAPNFDKANEIYFRLGIIYKQQMKYDQSLDCFQYIVASPPSPLNQTDIWFQIGHVYEQQKKYENAKQAYIKVLERDPKHAKVLQQLGWLHHQQSADYASQEQAIEYLEQSVSSDQTDAQSWYLLGRCYMSQHKFPKAYEAYQQAVYRDGRNPTFWCSIGVLYYQINQYRDALDAYSRAIRLNPNISEVWYDLGTLYESCNNQTTDALDAYQRAAELDPNNQAIKARLQLLRSGQSTGHLNQNGAPLPQDMPPQAYQPTNASGPAQTPWGGPSQPHSNHNHGPAPPPLQARDWGTRMNDVHGAPPPPPQQQPPINHFDQRDSSRLHQAPPPRHSSPKSASYRHHDPYGHSSTRRPTSPSPRSRASVADVRRSGTTAQPAPHQALQQSTPSRISNPNYGGQHLPPTPSATHNSAVHGPPPPYSRTTTPPAGSLPIQDGRPRSPPSHYQPSHSTFPHHSDPAGTSNIMNGAPPPSSALAAAEAAAREREREREDYPSQTAKRPRDWDSREDLHGNVHKKNASEETRARLDDPNATRRISSPTTLPPLERERMERPASLVASPDAMRRADENYRPSAVAHQPAPLSTVLHQEHQEAMKEAQHTQLPPINVAVLDDVAVETAPTNAATVNNTPGEAVALDPTTANQASANGVTVTTPKKESDADDMDIDPAPIEEASSPKRPEEPAARKMDVDENYDDESADEARNNHNVGLGSSGRESGESLPSSKEPAVAETNGVSAAAEPASVQA